jgi:pimeloyl-ACP methyl ester carboxylesterase
LLTGRWGLHLLAFDRPGYGASPPPAPGTVPSVVALVDGLAAYLRRSEKVADQETQATFGATGVVGWGEGGVWASVFAARHPELVDRLVLVDTPRPGALGPYRDRPISLEGLRIAEDDPNLGLPGVRDRLEAMLTEAGLQGDAGVRADADAIGATDWTEDVPRIRARTLVLRGEADPLVEASDARWFERRIPDARVREVAGTGMLAIVQCWEEVLEHVAPAHGHIQEDLRDTGDVQIERDPAAFSSRGSA